MNACEEYIEKMILSLDGGLSEQEELALQAHLAVCEGCRCLYETYRNIDMGILGMEEAPPEGLTRSVMQEIRLEKEKARPVYYLKRMKFSLTALAACLVLLVAGRFVGTPVEVRDTASTQAQIPETMAAAADAPVVEDTALMPGHDQTDIEHAVEKTMETAQEEAEAEKMLMEDGAMLQGRIGNSEKMSAVLEALNRDGYRGDLVELFDMTEAEIYERFPQAETLLISSGDRVYQVSWEKFDLAEPDMNYGSVVSTEEIGDWVYLWIEP